MSRRTNHSWALCFCISVTLLTAIGLAEDKESPADVAAAKTRAALITAFHTNLDYCKKWILSQDMKSLARTTPQLPIMVESIARYTDDTAQNEINVLREWTKQLDATAHSDRADEAGALVTKVWGQTFLVADTMASKIQHDVKKSTVGFNPLMSLISGTFADGKKAATVGDAAEAKSNALVLAELGRMLAVERNDASWKQDSEALVAAAEKAAATESDEPKVLKAVFHDVYANCEACHALRRP